MAAEYMDGQRAITWQVTLAVLQEGDGLWLLVQDATSGAELARWNQRELRVEDSQSFRESLIHVHHRSLPGALISAPRSEIPPEILRSNTGVLSSLPFLPHGPKQLLLLAVAFIALLVGVYFALTPVSAWTAQQIPPEWERKIGVEMSAILLRDGVRGSPESREAIDSLVEVLRPPRGAPGSEIEFDVHLVGNKLVNAFAGPGGVIAIHCGLVSQAETPSELAGVLAHEMQHVIHRHVLRSMVRSGVLTGLWSLALGDYSSFLFIDPQTVYQLAALKFSREDEAQADAGAVEMLDRAGFERAGMANFFKKMGKGVPSLLSMVSTHPATDARVELFSKETESPKKEPLSASQWAAVKDACA